MHPKERRFGATRREFLARTGGAAFALPGGSGLLAACGNSTQPSGAGAGGSSGGWPTGPGNIPLSRPNHPVKLPLWEDPIASGLEPETGGTFTVYNYPAYLYKKLLKDFGKKYKVDVQYTSFDNISSGVQRLASGAVTPDVMEMTPAMLDLAVAGKLMK